RLDPELRQAILRRAQGKEQKPRISFEIDQEVWLDVLVRLKDRRNIPTELLVPGFVVENPDPAVWEAIVTGAVREEDIEALRVHDTVLSFKASKVLTPLQETFSAQTHAAIRQ